MYVIYKGHNLEFQAEPGSSGGLFQEQENANIDYTEGNMGWRKTGFNLSSLLSSSVFMSAQASVGLWVEIEAWKNSSVT